MSIKGSASIFLLIIISLIACRRDDYYEGNDIDISFSTDTLRIDTVFTTVGSATRFVKIFNHKNQPILADIRLQNQSQRFFRLNIDGLPGETATNVEIAANDSIYVFVEVTIDPDQDVSISPFIIENEIEVTVNQQTSFIHLEAWGQNANYVTPTNGQGKSYLLSCDFGEEVWDDPKPYVLYGILYIDSCTLVLPAGTQLFVHGGIVRDSTSIYNDGLLIFLKDGRIDSRGTLDSPVIIQGDRLENDYNDLPSQWVGLLLWQESRGNKLVHTQIKNSIVGISTDSLAEASLYSCQIFNTGGPAVSTRHSKVYAENCLFYNNNSHSLQLTYGGQYEFNYCTIASYTGQSDALVMTDFYTDDPFNSDKYRTNRLDAEFTNCIFAGADDDEISLNQFSNDPSNFNYQFTNCAVIVKDLLKEKNRPDFYDYCTDCVTLKRNDRLFNNRLKNDYSLDTMSVLLQTGIDIPNITTDILERQRKTPPDIGCFEF